MKADMKRPKVILALLLGMIALVMGAMLAEGAFQTHLDMMKNPGGCGGCHRGHGKRGTQMLTEDRKDICFSCHGPSSGGRGGRAVSDIQSVFSKRYRHPVMETSQYHSSSEELPEKSPAMPRHVSCQDCHKVHEIEPGAPMKGIHGYKRGRQRQTVAEEDYELCYRCHSDSANLPPDYKNKADEFDTRNASYHPVEARGKNHRAVSLISPLNVSSTITCTQCHGNSDRFGPKGPHGSDYQFILNKQYVKTESAEGPGIYELCYSCHNRQSILNNESFQKHKEHVVYFHAPCAACHTPHGSKINPHLIELNTEFAGPSPMPSYVPANNGRPTCFISCHIGGRYVKHDNAFYTTKKWP